MSKVHAPDSLSFKEKAKARHSLRRRESSHIKLSRMQKAKSIGKGNYLYKYLIKEDRYETKRDENGSIVSSGYTSCTPYLTRWNMRGAWRQYKRMSNKHVRKIPLEDTPNRSEYKKAFDMAQFY